jgi:hypothetical protein
MPSGRSIVPASPVEAKEVDTEDEEEGERGATVAESAQTPAPEDAAPGDAPGQGGADGEALNVGEQHIQDGYRDFRKALEALPNAAAFQALVTEYGQQFGYRAVGRWVAGRPPKPSKSPRSRGAEEE